MYDDDLVERVARAVYQANPESGYDANDPRTFWRAADSYWPDEIWSMLAIQACTTIEAIEEAGYAVVPREPTDAMTRVVVTAGTPYPVRVYWRAMLDAALEKKDKANVG